MSDGVRWMESLQRAMNVNSSTFENVRLFLMTTNGSEDRAMSRAD